MRLRTQIAILAGGMFLIPIMVSTGGYFLMSLLSAARDPGDDYIATIRWVRNDLPHLLDNPGSAELRNSIPDEVRLAVFDSTNRVVFSTISRFQKGSSPNLTELFAYARTTSGHSHVQWEPVRTADGRQQVVMIEYPRRAGRSDFRTRIMLPAVVTTSCLLIFAVFTSAAIIRSLTRSVTNLETATQRVAGGDLDFELSAKGNSEVSSLTRSFEQMRRALKEEYARRARFVMGVSHDLKTPLSLIEGYAEAISDGLASEPQQHDRYISVIREKASLLEGIVNQLIDFAKLETSEWKHSHEPVNLEKFFSEIGRQYAQDAQLLDRQFTHRIELPETLSVAMDRSLVVRAFENLIGNAIRYTPAGGSIDFAASLVTPNGLTGVLAPGTTAVSRPTAEINSIERVRVTIHDTGVGIPIGEMPYIFDPFYRGSNSRREEGTGLGLAIVKSVIESHGWAISVNSEPSKGTSFIIDIPVRESGPVSG